VLTGSLAFYVIANNLIRSIRSRLESEGAEKFGRVGVVNGAISWDEPECGLLVIAPVRTFIAEMFPEPANVAQVCDAPYIVTEYAIQAIRCAPSGDESGNPPSVEALDRSAQIVIRDATVVLAESARYLCGLKDDDDISDYLTGPSVYVGPQGGAVGSEVHVNVALLRGVT
jgi:hypothetical protein